MTQGSVTMGRQFVLAIASFGLTAMLILTTIHPGSGVIA